MTIPLENIRSKLCAFYLIFPKPATPQLHPPMDLATVWQFLLNGELTEDEFNDACHACARQLRHFPFPADILAAAKERQKTDESNTHNKNEAAPKEQGTITMTPAEFNEALRTIAIQTKEICIACATAQEETCRASYPDEFTKGMREAAGNIKYHIGRAANIKAITEIAKR